MSNDDTGCICPRCKQPTIKIGLLDHETCMTVYCSKCEWEANWKKDDHGAFIKQ